MTIPLVGKLKQNGHPLPVASYLQPGVYLLHHEDEIVYVGQSVNMWRRIGIHIYEGTKQFDSISCIPCSPETMVRWEHYLIGLLLPRYNQCSHSSELRQLIADGRDDGAIAKVIGRPPRKDLVEIAQALGLKPTDLLWRSRKRFAGTDVR